ncbi:kynureninase [Thermobifida fusca TM51]|uniref:Kynureninase n=1 Tax=Thermobifida fusca TM51 TaxID=1169414 RepID=A0A9P2WRS6_THEFU|nr:MULTISPECIES: kynureninase [Thermobifida]EOR71928.1 kynureninase [Thermobifida fusca TM51]MBO2531051.1 kynureninase [Thermobifida sp.]MDD6793096.1 kynureninase [Thermobifida fusca]PPS92555.1 kynureninase [Thermobifida fusca]PZN62499.1 MAG: kynureninase [Thermobifida fusca]
MTIPLTREDCAARDAADPLAPFRDEFVLPDGVIYLDGNSLGALPRATPARVARLVEHEWGQRLIASWNEAGWWDKPRTLGALLAPLLGAEADEVVVGDGTSVNLFKTVAAALWLRPDRRVVVAEAGNFPTDGYIAQGVVDLVDGASLRMVDVDDPAALAAALEPGDVAVVLLSHVDYRTGILRDMAAVTEMVHAHGALVVWDVCHSVGAVPLALAQTGVDFAVGCTYKYLNAGPGAPAFTYVARRHHERVRQPISGWHGHARPFDFAPEYEPAAGASRFLSGSQSLIAAAALEASLELWQRVDLAQVREKSLALTDLFVAVTAEAGLECVTPAEHERRGSQVALRHPDGYPIVQALIARGVVGDFRSPDILRFGFAPLYLRYVDVYDAARALVEVVTSGEWQDPRFAQRAQVT